jgi:hypothetical protein
MRRAFGTLFKLRDMPPREALPEAVANRYDARLAHQDRTRGSSIYPAIQNIYLACRAPTQ